MRHVLGKEMKFCNINRPNLQNTSRRGGIGSRHSSDDLGRLEEEG
jgi:hypothetical protein